MTDNILNIIKETIDDDINSLYYMIWINTLDQFKHNINRDIIILSITRKNENYYTLIHYNGNSIFEIIFKMTKKQKELLYNLLIKDGFDINNKTISISREKIINYINKSEGKEKIKTLENTRNI